MSLADYDYQVWRKALHDLQVKIDNFDNNFWEIVIEKNLEGEALEAFKKESDPNRQKLVDELEAHYKSEPRSN
jgi:hypothetical protein